MGVSNSPFGSAKTAMESVPDGQDQNTLKVLPMQIWEESIKKKIEAKQLESQSLLKEWERQASEFRANLNSELENEDENHSEVKTADVQPDEPVFAKASRLVKESGKNIPKRLTEFLEIAKAKESS